jgi:predicted 3-demethylubiquinone-9 3-methyltransferase (glyoxalase superfamily)
MQIVTQKTLRACGSIPRPRRPRSFTPPFSRTPSNTVTHYPDEGREIHGKEAGSVMSVGFELAGQSFVALNGGPHFKFDEAISFQVYCDSQTEVDHFWSKLSAGGEEGPCGWLKDKFGLCWQVVPVALLD